MPAQDENGTLATQYRKYGKSRDASHHKRQAAASRTLGPASPPARRLLKEMERGKAHYEAGLERVMAANAKLLREKEAGVERKGRGSSQVSPLPSLLTTRQISA